MRNSNIGIIKALFSSQLVESYLSNDYNDLSKNGESNIKLSDFYRLIEESKVLKTLLFIFENFERKSVDSDILASKYIDSNLNLIKKFNIDEYNSEIQKLDEFINENEINKISSDKIKFYDSINNLILESLNESNESNVDLISESYETVLNHIKMNKKASLEDSKDSDEIYDETIFEIAIDKFNKKYESLNEEDKSLLKNLINFDQNEKNELLESYKLKTIEILEKDGDKDVIEENISKSIDKIKNIKFNSETIDSDLIKLHELKKIFEKKNNL